MAESGAKTYEETLKIKQRYAELTEPFFKFLLQMIQSKNKADKKWASEQLSKAYIKMIPQTITGDPENPLEHKFTLDDNTKSTIKDAIRGITGEIKQE